jgi:50S ribosomal subunit-associated GTPase HflX
MIDAFKSILQDTTYSNLVLLVVDISQPIEVKNRLDYLIHKMNEQGMPMKVLFLFFNKVCMIHFFTEVDILAQIRILCIQRNISLIHITTGFNIDL